MPAWHVVPPVQRVPQAPQLELSVCSSVQTPAQAVPVSQEAASTAGAESFRAAASFGVVTGLSTPLAASCVETPVSARVASGFRPVASPTVTTSAFPIAPSRPTRPESTVTAESRPASVAARFRSRSAHSLEG